MSDKPILFSGPMVRALRAGTKTQTRRLLGGVPEGAKSVAYNPVLGWSAYFPDGNRDGAIDQPRYSPGDRLYVRESVRAVEQPSGLDGYLYPADGEWMEIVSSKEAAERWVDHFHYASKARGRPKGNEGHLIPSIHMPKDLSRLTLHVTEARVQRLQDISFDDALAEGIQHVNKPLTGFAIDYHSPWFGTPQIAYRSLWNSINGAGSWDANPWVAAYTFEVEHCNIAQARKP